MRTVTVRYFAGARAASGVDTESREADSLDQLVGQIVDAHGERMARVLTACSFLVDGTQTRDRARWCCHPDRWSTCSPRSRADDWGRMSA